MREEEDVSGAVSWARCCLVDGAMRTWVDLEAHPCVGGHSIGCDIMLWTASLVLLRYLECSEVRWRDGRCEDGKNVPMRVLELSAGAGHLAVGLARLGAHVVATECSAEHDRNAWFALNAWLPHLLERPEIERNYAQPYQVGTLGGMLSTRILNWGPEDDLHEASLAEFDILILSELVALGEDLQVDKPSRSLRMCCIRATVKPLWNCCIHCRRCCSKPLGVCWVRQQLRTLFSSIGPLVSTSCGALAHHDCWASPLQRKSLVF